MEQNHFFYQPPASAAGFPWGTAWYTTLDARHPRFLLHWHKQMEILKLSGSSGEFVLNFQTYQVKDGDIVLISPKMFHSGTVTGKAPLVCGLVSIDLDLVSGPAEQFIHRNFVLPFQEERLAFFPVISEKEYPDIGEQIETVIRLFQTKADASLLLKAELLKLYGLLIDNGLFYQPEQSHIQDPANMKIVLRYIDDHLAEKITPGKLAGLAGYSPYHFFRKFKEQTGVTVTRYINSRRLSLAANLLVTTKLPVALVAEKCGLPNTPYFIRLFRETYSMTPLAFRRFYC